MSNNTPIAPPSGPSPAAVLDLSDPGADTARRFRYQHAYALVLLVKGAIVTDRFKAVWCEQHEDLLAERTDGRFDAYQVKTQVPEAGPIECSTTTLIKSVVRFVRHEKKYGSTIARYVFISNTAEIKPDSENQFHRCLSKLIEALKSGKPLPAFAQKAWEGMLKNTHCSDDELGAVLLKTEVLTGPGLDGTNDMLYRMLHKLPACNGWASYRIEHLRDYLLGKVYQASSLGGEDPEGYYIALSHPDHPQLQNKRITPAEIFTSLRDFGGGFRYMPGSSVLRERSSDGVGRVLRQKMQQAGLDYYFDSMLRKTVSAEQEFFTMLHDGREHDANQIECVVKDICDRARLEAELVDKKFGKIMHAKLGEAMDRVTLSEPAKVQHKSSEFLTGVAVLLAENCHVWWTERFPLEEKT